MNSISLRLLATVLILCARGSAADEAASSQPGKAAEHTADSTCDEQLAQMRALSQARQWKVQIEQFGGNDFASWPAEKAAAALHLRGRAYTFLKDGKRAKADLANALKAAPKDVTILLAAAHNHLDNLKDDEQALAAYRQALALTGPGIGWQPMTAAISVARILTDQLKTDEALEALSPWGDMETLAQSWRIRMLRTYGHIYAARGEEHKSLSCFHEALRLEALP